MILVLTPLIVSTTWPLVGWANKYLESTSIAVTTFSWPLDGLSSGTKSTCMASVVPVFTRALQRWAGESVVNSRILDTLLTRPDQLCHVQVVVILSLRNYCLEYSGVLSKFILQSQEYFINKLLRLKNLVVFVATSFFVFFRNSNPSFEVDKILIRFVVLQSTVCC